MRVIFRNLGLVAILFSLLRTSTGCNEATILGRELIPGKDFVNAQDTTIDNIITHNIWKTDSTVFTGQGNYQKVLGSINDDPLFGRVQGFVYTQMSLPSNAFSYQGANQTLDSVVLYIPYEGFYGDSLSPLTFRVYRMNEPDFKIDSNYRYYQALKYNQGELLGTATVSARSLRDSVSVYGQKQGPQLHITLSSAFGNQLLQQSSTGAFVNDSTFHVFLKGLAIVPDTSLATNRTMLYLNLNHASTPTYLRVYYKNSENDSLVASFPFDNTGSAHANYFVHNHTGAEANQYLNTNRPEGDSLLYLEDAPGVYTKVTIPNLENFPNVVINKAELVITEVTTGTSPTERIYSEPDLLLLRQLGNGDTIKPIIDYGNPQNPNQPYFGGVKEIVRTEFGGIRMAQYKFNIARYLQFLIRKQETNTGFRLDALSPRNIDVHRVRVGGGSHSTYNLKLRIIYTKL
ncbi:DUF4270 domain-containing protein [Chitinophaga agrisoli]|uniref:DUF4270 domain-containing protein n=1 Tax=Chitinophaga agrisoli TaxID=2607653 RepID=A0A5B2VUZ6_9BACT|nr:DUF4270 domain-containing protein [Chitinophaga agrisoli]KAA2242500.1 DUF4270 domain-containing protein [Chitinophaga agrisoli]